MHIKIICSLFFVFFHFVSVCQLKWQNVDSLYQPLPSSVRVYFTNDKMDTAAFRAYYVIADLKDKNLNFTTDTSSNRRLTPVQFYQKNNSPLLVVNSAFFKFDTHTNLNLVVKDGKLLAHNSASLKNNGIDSAITKYPFRSAIGITKQRHADIAWTYTDSSLKYPRASQRAVDPRNILVPCCNFSLSAVEKASATEKNWYVKTFKKWKMKTAVGGGPMLLQNGEVYITNEQERMFFGKAINDKHPRTAMGYTNDNKLIILVVEGRNPGASGATLKQMAQIFKDLGCIEALNFDGGGSSCLLINGKETIKISDKLQRPVPAVFLIKKKN